MTKSEKEHEMMARKFWCDVYLAHIRNHTDHDSRRFASEAYDSYKATFSEIPENQARDENGRFRRKD